MENQILGLELIETQSIEDSQKIKELFELQLVTVGGGCVEYCPY
jgi:hypothetical protein